jgi:hypothetical protein
MNVQYDGEEGTGKQVIKETITNNKKQKFLFYQIALTHDDSANLPSGVAPIHGSRR